MTTLRDRVGKLLRLRRLRDSMGSIMTRLSGKFDTFQTRGIGWENYKGWVGRIITGLSGKLWGLDTWGIG